MLNFLNKIRNNLFETKNIIATNNPNNVQCKPNKFAIYVPNEPPIAPENNADQSSFELVLVSLFIIEKCNALAVKRKAYFI